MDRIDELKRLIEDSRKTCAELEDSLQEIKESLLAEEDNTAKLKRALLEAVLKDKYESGYAIYSITYIYTYDDSTWKNYSIKAFDILAPTKAIEEYFKREANSYLNWNEIRGKASCKIDYDTVSIYWLSNFDVDDLLEELEPY